MSDPLSTDLASLKIDRSSNVRKRPSLWWLVAVGAIAASVFGYSPAVELLRTQVLKPEVTVTEVMSISAAQAEIELTSTGYVVPQVVTKVGVKLPGRVAAVRVRQGQVVEQGALLLELEKADHEASVRASQASVGTAQAQVHATRAQLAEVRLQAERRRALATQGVIPVAQAEDLEARVKSLSETVKAAQAGVAAARAQVAAQRVTLGYMSLTTPISGTVVSKPPEVGEVLNFELGTGASHLIEIADFSSMMVEIDVPESRLGRVRVGAPCEIVLDAFPNRRFRGVAETILPEVNRAKATVGVKVKFVDPMEGVLPQMAARVSFLGKELDRDKLDAPPKIVLPSSAVVERNGGQFVFVLDGDRVKMRAVELGPSLGSGFELISGPAPGTQVVSDPPNNLQDGQRIKEKATS